MSDAKRCDECGTTSESEMPLGWWCVARVGDLRSFDEPPSGWDFCSSTCLSVWAEQRVSAEVRASVQT